MGGRKNLLLNPLISRKFESSWIYVWLPREIFAGFTRYVHQWLKVYL
jgi:hypothetical protein